MAKNEKELRNEIDKIRNNAFDIKGYFDFLFTQLLPAKLLQHKEVDVVSHLVDEASLSQQLARKDFSKKYVILFYAHKPHSPAVSPVFPEVPPAHTSVLLCKVKDGCIQQVLNIDGYNNIGYVDVLGARGRDT